MASSHPDANRSAAIPSERMCHAREQLHGNEGFAFVFVHFEDGADVGVVQGRRRARLAPETTESLGIVDHIVRQEFQGDEAVELGVFGFVDHTHAAAAKLLTDAIVRDGLADHAQACYGGSVGKSMKAVELAVSQEGNSRKIER